MFPIVDGLEINIQNVGADGGAVNRRKPGFPPLSTTPHLLPHFGGFMSAITLSDDQK